MAPEGRADGQSHPGTPQNESTEGVFHAIFRVFSRKNGVKNTIWGMVYSRQQITFRPRSPVYKEGVDFLTALPHF